MSAIDQVQVAGTTYDVEDRRCDTKAEVDGYYESMTVGNSEQLVATVGVEDKVPYNFRTSGGSADIGDRLVDKIVGGSVAWNQLIGASDFPESTVKEVAFTRDGNGGVVANGTATGGDGYVTKAMGEVLKANHVYFQRACPVGGSNSTYFAYITGGNIPFNAKTQDVGQGCVLKITQETAHTYVLMVKSGTTANNLVFKPQLFDLTQMFGSTIADYIYTLESGTAGAGVAWFRKLFPKPYYAYNAGTLMSVKAASHDMTGFNQWDEEWETGGISNSDGTNYNNTTTFRSKNYIPVVPNTTYYFRCGTSDTIGLRYYDGSKNFVSAPAIYANRTFTTPQDACFMRFVDVSRASYNNDICINLHWDGERDGEYEPYVKRTYPLGNVELRGIPKLDADNKLYYDGDTYESDGTVTRKYGIVTFNGTETWGWNSQNATANIAVTNGIITDGSSQYTGFVKSSNAKLKDSSWAGRGANAPCIGMYYGASYIFVKSNDITSANDAKTFFTNNPTTVIYALQNPTTESTDEFTNPQIVDDWGTEEYVDRDASASTPLRDVAIPVGHDSNYRANLRAKLEMSPDSPDGDGDYIVRQASGQNVYVPITFPADELPAAPENDGNYVLKCTVSSGTATFTWASES